MALPKSGIQIPRQSVVNSEGIWTKMFDPPRLGPPIPDALDLTQIGLDGKANTRNPLLPAFLYANPVPSVMQAAGMMNPDAPYTITRNLMHGDTRDTWDGGAQGGRLNFYLFEDPRLIGQVPDLADPNILNINNPGLPQAKQIGASAPQYPAATYRSPRGAVTHNKTDCQGPPPHTIHWHGIEPTPMNDGVGHCSFEVEGSYTYQWQPSFIGSYFYHCHRNTMMHFEYGLLGDMLFSPPDAWIASIATIVNNAAGTVTLNTTIPFGAGFDGKFRTAANLNLLAAAVKRKFPGFIAGDPIKGVDVPDPGRDPSGQFKFPTDPWAYTLPYDVEAIWVLDDRSSQWSDGTKDAFASFPVGANIAGGNVTVGFNEGFHNKGKSLSPEAADDFFGFCDFNADYWYVTGIPVAAPKGGSVTLPTNLLYPSLLNSGQGAKSDGAGGFVEVPALQSRIDIKAGLGQTVFVRCLNAAYNSTRVTFPIDVVIIEWDGRALGVPPLNRYTKPILVRAGHPIVQSTARRWGAILNSAVPVNKLVKVEFLETRSTSPLTLSGGGDVVVNVNIPIVIN